ncbi:nickel pincer cofactor biosynthesis protein LarC [Pseudogemmatithrix spongiicola]|uniref:Putative nickel insertion protein n=1 Tax=Pseudogemmatithrix spongiicola TaxID=3062599 RepID=A0AA49JZZ9_9BACT|nr:nickel pincer cofactor biosynthesis protein LarC [Gemmatimonadaceae bacterium 'strain 138']WKW15066.1 nickel pincer cofactor biosynthesis protein LarC [Gemmatimonadaceae bacterium 'strain 318']
MTRIAILDPMSGIAGDMCLGALLDCGLPESFVRDLPQTLGIADIGVNITRVSRGQIACTKVDFTIPPQPHGRHLKHIKAIVDATPAPASVKEKANRCFTLITECEAAIHGTTVERVHLHEVGSVDAILDIVGTIWGLEQLGVQHVYCGTIPLGDGFVDTQHGRMAVPTAATLRLLEGLPVRPGPEGSGELTTPTGAALVRVLSEGPPPAEFVVTRSGFGAGTKDFKDRANALRIWIADASGEQVRDAGGEGVSVLAADVDDMTGEALAVLAERLRAAGALDVVLLQVLMKKGRPGVRIEVLAASTDVDALESLLLTESTTIGVRRYAASRRVLPRERVVVRVEGQEVALKVVMRPDGRRTAKPESDDVQRVAAALGRAAREVAEAALAEWRLTSSR